MAAAPSALSSLLREHQETLLQDWLRELPRSKTGGTGKDAASDQQAGEFSRLLADAASTTPNAAAIADVPAVKEFLREFCKARVLEGYTSDETAVFIFSLKRPVFTLIQNASGNDAANLQSLTWEATSLIDNLGLQTVRAFQKTREDVIHRQQQELLELSTPVVKLWDGVLALPLIGTLDSARTQVVMESLLQRIAESGSQIAIIDITGVPTVDTLVAQHLIKTVTAIRLMGADCIISGVRPQIAQTIVHLGVDLGSVVTKANIADALALALQKLGLTIRHAH